MESSSSEASLETPARLSGAVSSVPPRVAASSANGSWPVSRKYMTTPQEKTSASRPYFPFSTCA